MIDIRVLSALTNLKVTYVAPIRGFLPPSLMVNGENFDKASVVIYNGVEVKEFFVSSTSRLIMAIPESMVGKDIYNLQVMSVVPITGINSSLSLEIPKPIKSVAGIDRLVQSWVLVFMTSPGSDIFDLSSGGGGYAIVGKNTDRQGKSAVVALTRAIEKTTSEIKSKQASDSRIPLEERLLSAALESVSFDEGSSTLAARVSILNSLGDRGEVQVG